MNATHENLPIAPERQTVLELYVNAKEAYDMWQADPEGVKFLDVRTPEEYVFVGHCPWAVNIPFAFQSFEWDDEQKKFHWELSDDFLPDVMRWARPDDTILLSCRSGGRAAMAINVLAKAGFAKVYNILDGMEGSRVKDPESVFDGMRMKNGWKNANLPWTYEIDRSRMMLPPRVAKNLQAGNEHD
jgi:rhodanese-related sulfurtransferase